MFALVIAQEMVVGAVLEDGGAQQKTEIFSQERGRESQIAVFSDSDPDEMPVIGPQNIRRREKTLTAAGVKQDFTEAKMERVIQPTRGAVFERVRPPRDLAASVGSQTRRREFGNEGHDGTEV